MYGYQTLLTWETGKTHGGLLFARVYSLTIGDDNVRVEIPAE